MTTPRKSSSSTNKGASTPTPVRAGRRKTGSAKSSASNAAKPSASSMPLDASLPSALTVTVLAVYRSYANRYQQQYGNAPTRSWQFFTLFMTDRGEVGRDLMQIFNNLAVTGAINGE